MSAPIITLTTDFGTADSFVGAMKGVIHGINPDATLVDITHDVPPQDVAAGAFTFAVACGYFPEGTIHVLVVDPGVGTARRPLVVTSPDASFVCPDNGILSYVYASGTAAQQRQRRRDGELFAPEQVALPPGWQAFHLTNAHYWRHPVSSTFHGRDLFAPVAAHLSRGERPDTMGEPVDLVTAITVPKPTLHDGHIEGCVLHVDHFGNLITNIEAGMLPVETRIMIEVAGRKLHGLASSYQEGTPLVAIVGSHGYLEIAAANGNAAEMLGMGRGGEVSVTLL